MADERRFVRTARRWQLLYWLEVILLVIVLVADFIVEHRLGIRSWRGTLFGGFLITFGSGWVSGGAEPAVCERERGGAFYTGYQLGQTAWFGSCVLSLRVGLGGSGRSAGDPFSSRAVYAAAGE